MAYACCASEPRAPLGRCSVGAACFAGGAIVADRPKLPWEKQEYAPKAVRSPNAARMILRNVLEDVPEPPDKARVKPLAAEPGEIVRVTRGSASRGKPKASAILSAG